MTYTQTVIETVCARRGVSVSDVLSPARTRPVAWARQEAQHILREATGKSLPEIGREFGRDHTTVLYSLDAVEHRMKDDLYRAEIAHMQREAISKLGFTSARPDKAGFFKTCRKTAK
jgi:chromosomal replication initiation ATPase DnaA